jgi:four helix bundle protein
MISSLQTDLSIFLTEQIFQLKIKNYELKIFEMKENIIQQKSFAFAIRMVELFKYLQNEKKEFVLSKQILRSGTSIGANIEESIGGASDKDFLHKLTISYKEARETIYWLKLLHATHYISEKEFNSLHNDAEEICKILGKIQITLKSRNS